MAEKHRLTLPAGMTPLTPEAFRDRFPPIMDDLWTYLVNRLDLRAGLDKFHNSDDRNQMADALGKKLARELRELVDEGKVQFAVSENGDPAVFSAAQRYLTPEEYKLTTALVSYFDSTGTFNEQTGEVQQPDTAKLEALKSLAAEIENLSKGSAHALSVTDKTALVHLADLLRVNPPELMGLLDKALGHEGVTPESFVKAVLAKGIKHANEQEAERVKALADAPALAAMDEGSHDELLAELTAGMQVIDRLYTEDRIEAVLRLEKVLAQHWLAKDQPFWSRLSLAYLAYELDPVEPTGVALSSTHTAADPTWIVERYVDWRKDHEEEEPAEFLNYLVPPELQQRISTLYDQFRRDYDVYAKDQEKRAVERFPPVTLDEWIKCEVPDLVTQCAYELNASRRVVKEILDRWYNAGVISFAKTPKGIAGIQPQEWPVTVSQTERGLQAIFKSRFHMMEISRDADGRLHVEDAPRPESPHVKPPAPPLPPERQSYQGPGDRSYMRAVAAQYATLAKLQEYSNKLSRDMHADPTSAQELVGGVERYVHLNNWAIDMLSLRTADTVCWYDEQVRAAEHAAEVFPNAGRLTRDLFDATSGFWYFLVPRPVQTVTDPDVPIHALLWSWTAEPDGKNPALRITALLPTHDGRTGDHLEPSALGSWPEGMTLAQAVQHARKRYREVYGDKVVEGQRYGSGQWETPLIGEEKSVAAVEYMFRFFVQGWLWMKSTIPVLTSRKLRIEASKKQLKRLEEAAIKVRRPLTDVQVIQLRRRAVVRLDDPSVPEEERKRAYEYSCRWIVKGHTRNQYYPSLGTHKPKWIESYDKGPADKPLKVPSHRITVVNR